MIHPDTELAWFGPELGHGVRATRDIPRGTLTWVRCALDIVLDEDAARGLGPAYAKLVDRYAYVDRSGRRVLCWDHGRHVNHHCEPNSRGLGADAQIAVRNIAAGEALTCDYGECNLPWVLECACGSPRCRSAVHAADIVGYAERWDLEIAAAVASARTRELAQPLLPFVAELDELLAILTGAQPAPSVAELAYPGLPQPLAESDPEGRVYPRRRPWSGARPRGAC